MEWHREAYWLRHAGSSPFKLHWRALTVRHCFHVLPGESILEIGAGSGLWTAHLSQVLRGENPITAAVFNSDLARQATAKGMPNVEVACVSDLADLPDESFDYIVGTAILCHSEFAQNLRHIHRLLKPGGQLLFFESNYWNPQVALKHWIPALGRWAGNASCQIGLRSYDLMKIASSQGFTHIDVIPFDIIHPKTPRQLIPLLDSTAFVLEQAPLLRHACGTLYVWAKKPGNEADRRPAVNLACHEHLFGQVSVVVPCHNEEMNVPRLARALLQMYEPYIHEIVFVNDNSSDRTAEVTRELASRDPRIKLLNRQPPNGVGLALRDGYAAATGRYILSMDCDFVQLVPELRDLFDALAKGVDGAIGSRFTHDSVMLNYPFFKILCNRAFHLLAKLLLLPEIHDISNNLKLYKAEIFKNLDLQQPHFAANAETGLKPILAGYRIEYVPISWINRTSEMGSSSFRVVKVAPNYFSALLELIFNVRRQRAPAPGYPEPRTSLVSVSSHDTSPK